MNRIPLVGRAARDLCLPVSTLLALAGVSGCTDLRLDPNPLGDECVAGQPPREPDLMRWRADNRAQLALIRSQGVVAVRYQPKGCDLDLEVLPDCVGTKKYTFAPYSANDTKTSHNDSELRANFPIGGDASVGAHFKDGDAIRTDLQIAGVMALPAGELYSRDDLKGLDCDRATHVVARIYLGGFSIVAGKSQTIQGGASFFGAELSALKSRGVERVTTEGELPACERARAEGKEMATCNVPLRVGLLPLGTRNDPQLWAPDPATGLVPLGVADPHGCLDKSQLWNGSRCVNMQATEPKCPEHFFLPEGASECRACVPNVLAHGYP